MSDSMSRLFKVNYMSRLSVPRFGDLETQCYQHFNSQLVTTYDSVRLLQLTNDVY